MDYAATLRIGITFAGTGTVAPRLRVRQAAVGSPGRRDGLGAGARLAARLEI